MPHSIKKCSVGKCIMYTLLPLAYEPGQAIDTISDFAQWAFVSPVVVFIVSTSQEHY